MARRSQWEPRCPCTRSHGKRVFRNGQRFPACQEPACRLVQPRLDSVSIGLFEQGASRAVGETTA
ncbi:sporangia induced bZIP regulated hypothetical protein [Phytophthora infestans T30-4]|uniref:Uncharacterized protein n=1 Tax=Phytophthora infestans (strain T30-4) TaxID=403677 RepID=D0NCI8_PHYIT|nr:sporangia induced bZIP regulated hypothetical protein [Phytophthora infestans T30-4]EEY55702.1 sporangia induced bZIP regulated hypothetical protein [Phytophthora infestans T30-4]|eukprot:XP_002903278.1 sporangia induced bZIP regulated hypothetical protein [Phytophthora infestans T30-4]